jgi:hypothetical protein
LLFAEEQREATKQAVLALSLSRQSAAQEVPCFQQADRVMKKTEM